MAKDSFLIYGANGYSGELIARLASSYDLRPVLAGRNEKEIQELASTLGLPFQIFGLDDSEILLSNVQKHGLVIHAAGPFQFTARQMVEACIRTGTYYLDINGDISVFELLKKYDGDAKKAGVMILPGAGFNIIPSDCLAFKLKKMITDPVKLKLAFVTSGGSVSHGTAMSILHKLGTGGSVRKNGEIVKEPVGKRSMTVDFGIKKAFVMSIPWGDISTAYTSTGIPDIETYTAVSKKLFPLVKLQSFLNPVLRSNIFRNLLKTIIDRRIHGPGEEKRRKAVSLVWGQVENSAGSRAELILKGPDGYTMTAHACLIIARKVLNGEFKAGYQTPASAYGEDLVLEIPGTGWQ